MAIADVLAAFHELKRSGDVQDYMIFGSVAAMVHTRPFNTNDIDIGVAVRTDAALWELLRKLAAYGDTDGFAVVIQGTPVEVFPVDISPIIQDALRSAPRKRVEGMLVKVAAPEHLLLEALRVNRATDRARVLLLDEVVNRRALNRLFERLDDRERTLYRRYEGLTGGTAPRPA